MSQQLDAQGEAHEALGSAVNSYGQRVLNDARILGNLFTDMLPDLPLERNLLVTGAEAGVAAELSQYVGVQHVDPDTAVQLVARALSERRAIDPTASMWVAAEYAQALGYQVRPHSQVAAAPPPVAQPAPTTPIPEPRVQAPQAAPSWPPSPYAAPQGPPSPYAAPQGPSWPYAAPQGPSWPNAAPQGRSWPPLPPKPPPSRNGSRYGIIIGGAAVGLVVVFLLVAAVAHIAPFSKPSAAPQPTHPPVTSKPVPRPSRSPSPTPTPRPSLAGGITPVNQLLPSDIADPTTQCTPIKKPDWTSPGLVSALACTDSGLPNGAVSAYQLDSLADYNKTWQNFNNWSSFDVTTAGAACPPSSNGAQGITPWSNKTAFPQMQGQVLECWTGSNAAPIYVWSMPTEDAFIIAIGADGSSFKALDTWWGNNASPANGPTAPPSPQSS